MTSKKFVVHDTADVIITHKESGKVVLNAEMQLASISGTISEEDLRGGIGNRKLYKIRTDKDINLNIRSAFGDMEYWAMTQGVTVDPAGKAFVTKTANGAVTANATDPSILEVVLPALPATVTEAKLTDVTGEQDLVAVTTGTLTVPTGFGLAVGDKVVVYYTEEVTGRKLQIFADKFAEKYSVEYRTIAYDPETHKQYSNIYFVFPDCIPVGEFEISLENGTVYTPEIGFSVLTPLDSALYGEIIEEVVV